MASTRTKPKPHTPQGLKASDFKDKIRDDINAGRTYGEIADEIGISRSSVAGMVGRLKVLGEITYTNPAKSMGKRLAPAKRVTALRRPPKVVVDVSSITPLEVDLLDLGHRQCRYPVRSHGSRHWFCGLPTDEMASYCSAHDHITRVPSKINIKKTGHYRG
jgi:hypothetical protein